MLRRTNTANSVLSTSFTSCRFQSTATNSSTASSGKTSTTSNSSTTESGAFSQTSINIEQLQTWMQDVDEGRGPVPHTVEFLVDPQSRSAQLGKKYIALQRDTERLRYELTKSVQFLATSAPWSIRPARCALPNSTIRSFINPNKGTSPVNPTASAGLVTRVSRGLMSALPLGTSSMLFSVFCSTRGVVFDNSSDETTSGTQKGVNKSKREGKGALVRTTEATDDEQFARRADHMHRYFLLNYYSRMTLTPRKNYWLAVFSVAWNLLICVLNAAAAVVTSGFYGYATTQSVPGTALSLLRGTLLAVKFLTYGFVISPVAHLTSGFVNSCMGTYSALTGKLWFDATCGRYHYCDLRHVAVCEEEMKEHVRLLKTIGHWEFLRKKMEPDQKMRDAMKSMGFRVRLRHQQRLKKQKDPSMFGASLEDEDETVAAKSDPYEILQLKRNATTVQVKAQYKKLAKVYHPDVVAANGSTTEEDKEKATKTFESISDAYQILSNPDKRSAYDNGGRQGLKMHESKAGRFMSTTPGGMVQGIFGGRAFQDRLMGELYKSHWDLRFQLRISVSTHEFECLQCMRVELLALELSRILDVHALGVEASGRAVTPSAATTATHQQQQSSVPPSGGNTTRLSQRLNSAAPRRTSSSSSPNVDPLLQATAAPKADKSSSTTANPTAVDPLLVPIPTDEPHAQFTADFTARCDAFVDRLIGASFGPELTYELGQAYVISGRRFLGSLPLYAPKKLVTQKMLAGFSRLFEGFKAQVGGKSEDEIAKMILVEYFNMEFDNIMCDAAIVWRYVLQNVCQDQGVTEEVRKRRCYALWYLGQKMVKKGRHWGQGRQDDVELTAYLQQAATSTASTAPPPPF